MDNRNYVNRKISGTNYIFDGGESVVIIIPSGHCDGFNPDDHTPILKYHVICDNAYEEISYDLLTIEQIKEKYNINHITEII